MDINVIGNAPESVLYSIQSFEAFEYWQKSQEEFQLDIETNVTPSWCDKKLITIQLGQCGGTDKNLWVLQWSALTEQQKARVKEILEDKRTKLIHNAVFEYVVLKFHGITLSTVYDTMVAEKIVYGGDENAGYSLQDLTYRYVNQIMDKTEQTMFGDNILTESKVLYAATDIKNMDVFRQKQLEFIAKWKMEKVLTLENKAVLSFADITYYGMELKLSKWRENIKLAQPIVDSSLAKLNEWITSAPFYDKGVELGYISDKDRLTLNVASHQQKREVLSWIFPDMPGGTKLIVKKYIRDCGPQQTTELLHILIALADNDTEPLKNYLIANYRDKLIENGFLIAAGEVTVNWNSTDQVLPLVKLVEPQLKNLNAESKAKCSHPIFIDLDEYIDALKLINTYGETFIEKHVEPDGKVRTSFNQIVSTGRVSSSRPNMQNIPAKESVGTRYRNAFVCEEDEVFVDSDFTGQELAIIAYISQDPVWLKTIEEGKDLHSVCAEKVYGQKWSDARSTGCEYYKVTAQGYAKMKCNCSQHKKLRSGIKTINFGLAYGMSAFKLSATMRITKAAADILITEYFREFPNIKRTLQYLGEFGVKNGYIQTIAPTFRKRWFPFWKFSKSRIAGHLAGQYDGTLGMIERQSKNQPIQGCGADMMKTAQVMVRMYIYKHGLQDQIKTVAQVHDQLTTICKKSIAEQWKLQLDCLMQSAAKVFIPSGILKADTNITDTWTK